MLRIYVETSVISYLTNRTALDVITAGHQATTYRGGSSIGVTLNWSFHNLGGDDVD